nr:MAG TPA: Pulmonary surfactant-associated protein D, c-type lectin, alpha-helical coiled [Caudoviricetes sp.]
MSNARIQFSTASEEKWLQVNPMLREGELVIARKANGKRKLVVGKAGGSSYANSEVVWDAEQAETYMTTTKDLSENVNVFVPHIDSAGILTWTNKAGLANPTAVNIKGAKGDKGDPGLQGPKGDEVTIDEELSSTSINPVQNKVVKTAIDTVNAAIPTKVSDLENDANYLTQHQSLAGYAKTSVANTWTAQQNFYDLMLNREKYTTYVVNSTSDTPITSTMVYAVTGAFTLNLATLAKALSASQSSVFTAYFAANADYSLTISNAGTLKYTGSASDVAITSAGLLLNIWMSKDGGGTLTSIVQASKLS